MKAKPFPLVPLDGKLIVERKEPDKVTKGGILLPDTKTPAKTLEGRVVAVGPGKRREDGTEEPMPVAVGQRVLFGQFAGTEVEVEGEKFLGLHVDDLLAVVLE